MGQIWSTGLRMQLETESGVKNPKIAPAAGGGFHASYKVVGSSWQIRYRRWNNGWQGYPTNIPNSAWPGGTSDICEANNGDIWYTWENWLDDNLGGEQIYTARSTNGGASWTTYDITQYNYPSGQGGQGKNPNIAAYGPPGSSTVIAPHWRAYYKELSNSVWNGSSWSLSTPIGTSTDNEYATYGVYTSPYDGSVYRVYSREINGIWQCCIRRFNGFNWDPEIIVSTHTDDQFIARPAVAVNQNGRVLVIWERDSQLWSREWTPQAGWDTMTLINDGHYAGLTHVPGRNDFVIVYTDTNTVLSRRYVARKWEGQKQVSVGLPAVFTVDCDAAADYTGRVFACWESHPTPGPVAYYSVFDGFVSSDTTPPPTPAPTVDTGSATDSTSDLFVSWTQVSDPESAIDHYEYSVGTAPGAYNIRFWTHAGLGNSLWISNLSLTPGQTYYVNVRAVNTAGKEGVPATTDGILCNPTTNEYYFGSTADLSSGTASNETPMLAKAADGGMHLVFRDANVSGQSRIVYRKLNGQNWGTAEYAVSAAYNAYFPDVAEGGDGAAHVIFTSPGSREDNQLYEAVKTAGWSTPALLNTLGTINWYPHLAAGYGNSDTHFAAHGDGTNYNVKTGSRANGAWNAASVIGTGNYKSHRYGIPDIASDASNNLTVVYTSPLKVYLMRRANGIWSPAVTIADHPSGFMCYPRVALDANNLAHVVYSDHGISPDPALYYIRETSPGVFTAPTIIANGTTSAIAFDSTGRANVVYGKGNGGNTDIYHKYFNGYTWSVERNLSNNSGVSSWPSLRADASGILHLAWQDNSSSVNRILYRKAVGAPPSLGTLKRQMDGTTIDLYGKIVSGVFPNDGCIYVQDADRSAGIRVQYNGTAFAAGDKVVVTGTLGTRVQSGYSAEKIVNNAQITRITIGPPPEPLFVNARAFGGGAMSAFQKGVIDGAGLNNIGLLVKITGIVTEKSGSYIWVDDGGGYVDPSGPLGVFVKCTAAPSALNIGDSVTVTGVISGSIPSGYQDNRRYLLLRSMSDIVKN